MAANLDSASSIEPVRPHQKLKNGYLQKCSRIGSFQRRWFMINRHGVLSYYNEDKTTLRQQYAWFNLLTDETDCPDTDFHIMVREPTSDRGCSCVVKSSSSATDRRLVLRAESFAAAADWKLAVAAASAQRGSFGSAEQITVETGAAAEEQSAGLLPAIAECQLDPSQTSQELRNDQAAPHEDLSGASREVRTSGHVDHVGKWSKAPPDQTVVLHQSVLKGAGSQGSVQSGEEQHGHGHGYNGLHQEGVGTVAEEASGGARQPVVCTVCHWGVSTSSTECERCGTAVPIDNQRGVPTPKKKVKAKVRQKEEVLMPPDSILWCCDTRSCRK